MNKIKNILKIGVLAAIITSEGYNCNYSMIDSKAAKNWHAQVKKDFDDKKTRKKVLKLCDTYRKTRENYAYIKNRHRRPDRMQKMQQYTLEMEKIQKEVDLL